jgi:hypothetical protein
LVDVHDFPGDALDGAMPGGVHDAAANDEFVSVGVEHDTHFRSNIDRNLSGFPPGTS